MTGMPRIESMRDMSRRGMSNAEIGGRTGVSQPTIRKYLAIDDFSPEGPSKERRASILDPHEPFVDAIMDADGLVWHKQRHTAAGTCERLLAETDYDGGYGVARLYVRRRRDDMAASDRCFLELVWAPGEAQLDFGDVDVVLRGERTRTHFLVPGFPFPDMGFAQLFGGEASECVCQGLADMFAHVGGVPPRVVPDNATGAGRRAGRKITEADLFARARAHYGFGATSRNPNAGHEKGNVERKVAWVRQHLMVPVPVVDDIESHDAQLLGRCDAAAVTEHHERHVPQGELFERDRAAMLSLPARPMACVRYARVPCDRRGDATVDGGHRYHVADSAAGRRVIVAYGAHTVAFADEAGTVLSEHPRRFGAAGNGPDPVAQLAMLSVRPGARGNSATRLAMPADVTAHTGSLEAPALSDLLSCMGRWCRNHDVDAVASALSEVLARTGRTRGSDVGMMLSRMDGFGLGTDPDVGPDLSAYDEMLTGGGVA